jgi:tetratricopeptide (TPR) repeat protein
MLKSPIKLRLLFGGQWLTLALSAFMMLSSVLFSGNSYAQYTAVFHELNSDYLRAIDLFEKQKYNAAQQEFQQIIARIQDPNHEIQVNAEYYVALCALELFHQDSEFLLRQFIKRHPDSPRAKTAYFQLARDYYRRKQFDKAIIAFNQTDVYDLSPEDVGEYYFKRGFAYFNTEQYDKASTDFYEIKDAATPYFAPANYYFAHINYEQGHYQTAYETFRKIEQEENFAPIVPYYITQILFLQRKFDDLIAYAPPVLERTKTKRAEEIAKVLGNAFYEKREYEQAIPYLDMYYQSSHPKSREDAYQLGYAYYRIGDFQNATELFKRVIKGEKDELEQTAHYQLADAYLKLDRKNFARNSFKAAYELEFDPQIVEDALFNYAVLSHELSRNPYGETVHAFTRYINDYPQSIRKADAIEYLLNVFMTTRDYSSALKALDEIPSKDFRMEQVYQTIAFNRGVELFDLRRYEEAVSYFFKARSYQSDSRIYTQSTFWIGEAFYRQKKYPEAIEYYEKFQRQPGVYISGYYNLANYNIAYAYYNMKDYDNAERYFRNYTTQFSESDKTKLSDAYLRLGDSFYVRTQYNRAIENYEKAIELNINKVDYALYQKALCEGIQKLYDNKINTLNKLLNEHPNSSFVVDSKYQLGETYVKKNDHENALKYFNIVVEQNPTSSFAKRSLLQIGLIQYKESDYQQSLQTFKRYVRKFPNYEDSKEALEFILVIYKEQGDMEAYADYIESLDFVDKAKSDLDKDFYESAENQYLDGNCAKAVEGFRQYLSRFQPALFAINANYYMAECELKSGNESAALEGFNFVISQPFSKFKEPALASAAEINYKQGDYQAALSNYTSLEKVAEFNTNVLLAQKGQMRCFYHLENYDYAIKYALLVLKNEDASANLKTESSLLIANSYNSKGNTAKAIEFYRETVQLSTGKRGAEAKYNIARIVFEQGDLTKAEEEVFELVHLKPGDLYWMARGYILLADIYFQQDDSFQAKATLQSIIENYKGDDDVLTLAQEKMDKIIAWENKTEETPEIPEPEIDLGDDRYRGLFEDEKPVEETFE